MCWLKTIMLIIVIPLFIYSLFLIVDIYKTDQRIIKHIKKIKKNNGVKTPTFRRPVPPPEPKPYESKQLLCDKRIHKPVCRFYYNGGIELPQLTFCCCYCEVENPEDWINKEGDNND